MTTPGQRTIAKTIAAARGFTDDSIGGVFNKLSDDVPKNDAEMLQWYKDTVAGNDHRRNVSIIILG